MKPSDILIKAQRLIEKPENWNDTYYRSGSIFDCDGAIAYAAGLEVGLKQMDPGTDDPVYLEARNYASKAQLEVMPDLVTVPVKEVRNHVLASWHGITHDRVMKLFDKAIENAKADGR